MALNGLTSSKYRHAAFTVLVDLVDLYALYALHPRSEGIILQLQRFHHRSAYQCQGLRMLGELLRTV
jgi:hypothetical protein